MTTSFKINFANQKHIKYWDIVAEEVKEFKDASDNVVHPDLIIDGYIIEDDDYPTTLIIDLNPLINSLVAKGVNPRIFEEVTATANDPQVNMVSIALTGNESQD